MVRRGLKERIIIPLVILLFILVGGMTTYSSIEFFKFTTFLHDNSIISISKSLISHQDDYRQNTKAAAISAARFPEVVKAVSERNAEQIVEVLAPLAELFNITYFTVTDENGNVLVRTYDKNLYGDNVSDVQNIKDAMEGRISTFYESGPVIHLSVHTGAPVYNANGNIIGVISAGIRFDENDYIDRLKDRFNAEFSIYLGYTRITSTMMRNEERNTGINYVYDFSKSAVHGEGYFDTQSVMDVSYRTFWLPIADSNDNIIAAISVGVSDEDIVEERNRLIMSNIIIGVSGLLVSILILLQFINRITRPVKNLVDLVSKVTQGNLNIYIDDKQSAEDEIDSLSYDVYLLIKVIKSMLNDLSCLTRELNTTGDIEEYQIDTSKYSGSYKEIIEGINELCHSISLKNKTVASMDFLDTMISVVDFNYNILYLNKSMIDAYGIDKEECNKKKCYKVIMKIDEPCSYCKMKDLRKSKDPNPDTDYEYKYDVILKKWISVRAVIIPWVDGSKVLCNYVNDETQVKSFEDQLRIAAQKAHEASVAKSAFLANMSHEIRTPMNSIMGFSELALDDIIPERTREYLDKILDNTKGLLQIINDILDISKVESGRMEIEKIPFDFHELFTNCKTIIMPKAAEKGISLYFYVDPIQGKMPLGDPTKLRQVFVNLIANAVKFTNAGTVKILAEMQDRTDNTVTIYFEVKDSGIGIMEEQMEFIFEPFVQGESGTTRQYGGSGLGLTITKNIIELMGGTLSVDSKVGIGSKFYFTLTFDTIDISGEKLYEQKMILSDFGKPTFEGEVLLCEDNAMNQQVICEHLERVGLKTVVAWNGRIGLDLVKMRKLAGEKQFDLIFMDMHMPVMDGLEATERILELNTGIPIVAMTANIMADATETYRLTGLHDCVGKPFTSQELWRCLLKFLTPVDKEPKKILETEEDFQKSLQSLFVRSNQMIYEDITKAIKDDDVKLAHRLTHSLKSNAAQIGKTELQKAAIEVESVLKKGDKNVSDDLMDTLKKELDAVLAELAPVLQEEIRAGEQTEIMEIELAIPIIDELESCLKKGSPECINLIDRIRRLPGDKETKNKIIQQIEDFDFDTALDLLNQLKRDINIT
ncbi:MAG: ATP-binding protein [Treponema sp.]|nr:ATP-binding protein [Treponema sp.]MCL2237215.1 ATP-binding protein [Treponema sp.]